MQVYCLVCKKFTDNANSRVVKINDKLMSKSIVQYVETKNLDSFHKNLG